MFLLYIVYFDMTIINSWFNIRMRPSSSCEHSDRQNDINASSFSADAVFRKYAVHVIKPASLSPSSDSSSNRSVRSNVISSFLVLTVYPFCSDTLRISSVLSDFPVMRELDGSHVFWRKVSDIILHSEMEPIRQENKTGMRSQIFI